MLSIPALSARRTRALLTLIGACAALGAIGTAPALADHSQLVFFEAPKQLYLPSTRPKTFATLKRLGVKALRVELHWNEAASPQSPNSSRRPSFNAENPSSYNFAQYVAIVQEANRLKWPVLLTVTSPVPEWATSTRRDHVTRPNAKMYEEFMTAVGLQFGSSVDMFAIWNEPNIPGWLSPQFNANGTPASPRIYRGLYQAGYAGLLAAGLKNPKVLFGETAPFGVEHVNARNESLKQEVAPLTFMREALCLNSHYRKSGSCGELQMYGYSTHPYTYPSIQGVTYRPPDPNQVTIGTLSRLSNALNLAADAHAIPAHLPILLTEFGVQTKPNTEGVSLSEQPEYQAAAEKIAWENPRVTAFSQYLLEDETAHSGGYGYRTGLETSSGAEKPLYQAWPIPLVVSRSGSGYSLWGLVRPAEGATRIHLYVQAPGSSRWRSLRVVQTNSSGAWTLHSSTRGSRWKVSWRSPLGLVYNGPPIGVS
jgi:hypothetical protein